MVPFKKNKETPTEQLLRMIEGPQPAPGIPKTEAPAPSRRHGGGVQGAASAVWKRLLPGQREIDGFLWNLRVAQRVLWVALAGLGVYVVYDVAFGSKPHVNPRILVGTTQTPPALPTPSAGSTIAPMANYLLSIKERNPFTGESANQEKKLDDVRTTKRQLEEMASGLVVVGIDRGPNPIALIENSAQKRTFMVKVGDDVGGMIVKRIGAEGVIVSYEGEEYILP